jgi:hypothetical protein
MKGCARAGRRKRDNSGCNSADQRVAEMRSKARKPSRRRAAVAVDKRDQVGADLGQTCVARSGRAAARIKTNQLRAVITADRRRRAWVPRSVVYH